MGQLGHGLTVDPIGPYMPGALGQLGHELTVDPFDPFDVMARLSGAGVYGSNRSFSHREKIAGL